MKILFTIPQLTYSGAPKMMAWIANQMAQKGHEIHLVTFFSEEQARLLHENIIVHSLKIVQSKNRLIRNTTGMFKAVYKLHQTVKRINPDIVLTFQNSVGYVYLLIGRLFTKCRFIISERADPYSYRGKTAAIRFFLMRYAHMSVFQTEGAKDFFYKHKKIHKNSIVIPNPVIVNESIRRMQKNIISYEERDHRIVTVGRLSLHQKRQDVLLKAFKLFLLDHPEYNLVVYGDGEDRAIIQEMIDAEGLTDRVILAGRIDKVEETIFKARAFVLSSDYEGIPNALIEAMSVGVPSISTNCSPGGAALLIKEGENGFIVPCGDFEAIAEKLSILVDDKTISRRFSHNGPMITEIFSEDVIAEKWNALFVDILNDRKKIK